MGGTILVTGASGFAGSHLVELLAARGPVTAWTRSAPPSGLASLATWQRVDLLDRAAVDRGIGELRPSAVYHCAGSPHVAESWTDTTTPLSDNVMTTHHLLQALGRSARGARVLVPGSAHVYAPLPRPLSESDPVRPASPYAVAKFAQEQLGRRAIAEDGVEVILTRSFNHTGARQTDQFVAPSFAKQIALIERGAGEPVIRVGNLDAQRDLTDVRDVVLAYVALMDKGPSGDIFNVASGAARPVRAVLDGLIARARVPVRVEQDPARMRPSDIPVLAGDYSRLRAATGWSPQVSFDRMLDDLLAYWRQAA